MLRRIAVTLSLALALGCSDDPASTAPPADASTADVTPDVADASVTDAPGVVDAPSDDPCDLPITAPPPSLTLDPFYVKYLDASGIPIVSSRVASDPALRAACRIVRAMVSARDDVYQAILRNRGRVGVMARTEMTTDIPEHAFLASDPMVDWNMRARGLGATLERPLTTCAEENLLCEEVDRYRGANILVHEFAHAMMNLGIGTADPAFVGRVREAYRDARAAGLWDDTYAGSNMDEYWAEGVTIYFNVKLQAIPGNGIHNAVNTRAELLEYDRALHDLVAEMFPGLDALPVCFMAR